MDFHLLDLIMYVVLSSILWVFFTEEFKEGFGIFLCFGIELILLIIYMIIFVGFDVNWVDLIPDFGSINFSV